MRKLSQATAGWTAAVVVLLVGCTPSDELTRSRAEKLITESVGFPVAETYSIRTKSYTSSPDLSESWVTLQEKGYVQANITLDESRRGANKYLWNLTVLDKGNKYVAKKYPGRGGIETVDIVTNYRAFEDVTGIALNGDKTAAQVEYTWVYEPTPFGKEFTKHRGFRNVYGKFSRIEVV